MLNFGDGLAIDTDAGFQNTLYYGAHALPFPALMENGCARQLVDAMGRRISSAMTRRCVRITG